jgi:hypothetical protein
MMHIKPTTRAWLILAAVAMLASCATMDARNEVKVVLTGAEEVPPVATKASGSGTIVIAADKTVTGSVTTSGVAATAAHIHMAPAGKTGPVIVPMEKTADNVWTIKPGSKLTDAQYESFKAGHLYVNVHSAAHKGGEIRGQLKP